MTPKTILVVDDDPMICETIRGMLETHPYTVLLAHDGIEAFERAQNAHIDLILMDIRMPFFSGYWFCDAFKHKKNTSNIPIVIVSGLLDEEGVEKAMHCGACATMKKPFSCEDLLAVVEKNAL